MNVDDTYFYVHKSIYKQYFNTCKVIHANTLILHRHYYKVIIFGIKVCLQIFNVAKLFFLSACHICKPFLNKYI